MYYINGAFTGISFSAGASPSFTESEYDTIKLYGYGIFDKVWIRNEVPQVNLWDDSVIWDDNDTWEDGEGFSITSVSNIFDYAPTFDSDTVFLAEFNNNLKAGNSDLDGEELEAWRVVKRRVGSQINELVGEFGVTTTQAYDYRVQNGQSYIYQVTPKTATKLGQPLVSQATEAEHYGIFLIDEDNDTVIDFNVNGSIGTTNAIDSVQMYETFNKYDTISQSDRNILNGRISGIVYENNTYCDDFIQQADFIDTIQDFVENKSSKLLKTRKGNIYKIHTWGFQCTPLDEKINEQIMVISFNWQEIEDVTDY